MITLKLKTLAILQSLFESNKIEFSYKKINGLRREAKGTRNLAIIPAYAKKFKHNTKSVLKEASDKNHLVYFDFEASDEKKGWRGGEWRTFRVENLQEILNIEPVLVQEEETSNSGVTDTKESEKVKIFDAILKIHSQRNDLKRQKRDCELVIENLGFSKKSRESAMRKLDRIEEIRQNLRVEIKNLTNSLKKA